MQYLDRADFSDTTLNEINFYHASLKEANLTSTRINEGTFESANLENANLDNSVIFDVTWDDARISNLSYENAEITDSDGFCTLELERTDKYNPRKTSKQILIDDYRAGRRYFTFIPLTL